MSGSHLRREGLRGGINHVCRDLDFGRQRGVWEGVGFGDRSVNYFVFLREAGDEAIFLVGGGGEVVYGRG